jgi:ABC-type polysaccharide/polyol phosphate transport system ATPase subunit
VIVLNSVTKFLGRGAEKKLVIDEIDWAIKPRTSYVILGHKAAGKSTLLHLISGTFPPTSGWVERRGIVSSMLSPLRLAGNFGTPQHLAEQLAVLYRADADRLGKFVAKLAGLEDLMTTPVRRLKPIAQQKLSWALFYGLPCDLYLFDGKSEVRLSGMRDACKQILEQRRENSSVILATSSTRAARNFDADITGILYRGKVRLCPSLESAIELFDRLPAEPGSDLSSVKQRTSDNQDLEEAQ